MSRTRVNLTKLPSNIHDVFVDGDIFVYTIGFAVEETIEWPDAPVEIHSDLPLAKTLLDNRIYHFMTSAPKGVRVRFVITGDAPNWRKGTLAESYKSGRGRKPTHYKEIRQYMREQPNFVETVDGLEADDFMATATSADPDGTAIVSFDKDFFTAPGSFVHMSMNSSARLYRITPVQAMCFLMFQALSGDRVDSYSGVDKIGPTKAKKMLFLCELKGLTIRQAYLLLKSCVLKREKQFKNVQSGDLGYPGKNLWKQFRTCLDLAALVQVNEVPARGIGLRRVASLRSERFEYFLPYYDPECTHKHTVVKMGG